MTKGELIKAMEDFPDEMPVRLTDADNHNHDDVITVTEICPTSIDTSKNYLLLS